MARRATPVIDAAMARVRANRPLVGAVMAGLRKAVADANTSIDTPQVETLTAEIVAAAVTPLITNATNAEPTSQSRVVSGSSWATIGGLGMLLTQLGPMLSALDTGINSGSKWAAVLGFLFGGGAFGGGIFALFGRLKAGLPPMTRRLWNPFSWFAPKKEAGQ